MDVCLRALKESNKSRFDSYSVSNSVLIISHNTFRDYRVHIFPTTFLEKAVYTRWKNNRAQVPYIVKPHLTTLNLLRYISWFGSCLPKATL